MSWGSFPQEFVDAGHFTALVKRTGKHRLGVVKVYLALSLLVDFSTREVTIGLKRLLDITGMSKPFVLRSLAELESAGVVVIERTAYRNRYQLLDGVCKGQHFVKIPKPLLARTLSKIPNRGMAAEAALSLYVILLARRTRQTTKTIGISHERLRDLGALRPEQVRSGLDVLFNHRLVHIREAPGRGSAGHPLNEYTLLGQFGETFAGLGVRI